MSRLKEKLAEKDSGLPLASNELLAVGSIIDRNGYKGKILAVGWVGERYYWLDCDGVISMIPAATIDG